MTTMRGISPGEVRASLVLAGRRYRALMSDRNAATLLLAALGSSIGDWLNFVAVVVVASRLGVNELAVGGALAIRFIPRLLFQGPAGALVDRLPGRALLISSQLAMGVIAGSFLLLDRFPYVWLLFGLIFLLESVYTIARPAFAVQVLRVVPPPRRGSANAVLGIGLTTAQFVGGWLGGMLLATFGEVSLFTINSLSFVLLAAAVMTVRPAPRERSDPDVADAASDTATAGPAVDGYARLLRIPEIGPYLALQTSIVVLIQATVALFVARAGELGHNAADAGTLIGMVGLGLLIGSALGGVGAYLGPTALLIVAVSELTSGVFLVGFGLVGSWHVALVLLVASGVGSALSEIAAVTYFQNRLPEHIYGRFYSLFLLAISIGGLTGSLAGPLLKLNQSVGSTLLLIAFPALASSVWLWRLATTHSRRLARLTAVQKDA